MFGGSTENGTRFFPEKKTLEVFSLLQPAVYSSIFSSSIMRILKLLSIFYEKKWAKKIKVYKQEEASQSDRSAL
jgi:hypothetical protein